MYYGLKKRKSSKLLDQRRNAKLQWLQDPSQTNGDNLINVRHDASRHFTNKEGNM
jgi:hypothetical protein